MLPSHDSGAWKYSLWSESFGRAHFRSFQPPPARPVAVRSRGRGDARTGVEGPLGGLFAIVLPVWTQHDVH